MRALKATHRAALRGVCGLASTVALVLLAAGCGGIGGWTAPLVPPPGLIYTSYSAPLDLQLTDIGAPTHTENLRVGEAKAQYLQLFYRPLSFTFGDASVETAAKNGGIQNLEFADYKVMSVLGLYVEFTTQVYGE